jgi:3-deoxy-D-manno-octulosonic-acid transferase
MQNFIDAVAALRDAGGLTIVDTEIAAADWVRTMLTDEAARVAAGAAAARAANQQAELPARMAARLTALMQ